MRNTTRCGLCGARTPITSVRILNMVETLDLCPRCTRGHDAAEADNAKAIAEAVEVYEIAEDQAVEIVNLNDLYLAGLITRAERIARTNLILIAAR